MASVLVNQNGKKVLMVNGEPFLLLAGEVHNSSATSVLNMEKIWTKADEIGLNCVLMPITWELFEPVEGEFDFGLVDGLIEQARKHDMKIGFLWFGAWKNAQCYFAPEWVKMDTKRFQRAQVEKGKNFIYRKDFHNMSYSTLSYLCPATQEADAKAFTVLMEHIKEIDEKDNTVVMIQVENEPGLQGAARENSDEADRIFTGEVPPEFIAYLKNNMDEMAPDVKAAIGEAADSGSWQTVFGDVAEEIFSAYHVASYIEAVASAGRNEYDLPMFVNCWLDKGDKPGIYPSGGPVARMMEVWQYCAPSIDIYGVDNYARKYCEVCDEYAKRSNPLLVPETGTHSHAGPRLIYMVGHYHALGFAPFAFEDMGKPFSPSDGYLFGIDMEDPALSTPQDIEEYWWINKTLHAMTPLLTMKYGTDDLRAVIKERGNNHTLRFGDYEIRIMMEPPFMDKAVGACLILRNGENEFYMVADGCCISAFSANPDKPNIDVLALEEGFFEEGEWQMNRRLNGDEVVVQRYEKPTLLRMKLFVYA